MKTNSEQIKADAKRREKKKKIEAYLLIMRKFTRRSTTTFASLKSMAYSAGLSLLSLSFFIFFLFSLITANMINPYNSAKNLSTIQVIYMRQSKTQNCSASVVMQSNKQIQDDQPTAKIVLL